MSVPTLLFHYGSFQPLWQQPHMLQAGPAVQDGTCSLNAPIPHTRALQDQLHRRGLGNRFVLLHYSDPFLLRSSPLRGLQCWPGPKLLACGDLHHGPDPISSLATYLQQEFHDAVLLTFNPALLAAVQQRLRVPVRCLPPTFFRYPSATRALEPRLELLHVGSLGPHHPRRRALVETLQSRGRIPFRHATTTSPEAAATLYAQHALVLNAPLHHDLNHRFFEVMAAGAPQVVFGNSGLLGTQQPLGQRPDVFWADSLESLEALVQQLFAKPEDLRSLVVSPPPHWDLQDLLKEGLAP